MLKTWFQYKQGSFREIPQNDVGINPNKHITWALAAMGLDTSLSGIKQKPGSGQGWPDPSENPVNSNFLKTPGSLDNKAFPLRQCRTVVSHVNALNPKIQNGIFHFLSFQQFYFIKTQADYLNFILNLVRELKNLARQQTKQAMFWKIR